MTPGQAAFRAWSDAHGNPASWPAWDRVPGVVKQRWETVAGAVISWHLARFEPGPCAGPGCDHISHLAGP